MGNQRKRFSVAHLFFLGLFSFVILLAGCKPENESKNAMPTRDINTVMEAHTGELMAIPGIVGVAIGENDEKKPCILVLIVEEKDEILEKIPKEIEGHPVCPLVSGEIKPMSDK